MKRLSLHLNLNAIIVLIAAGVLVPVMLATAVGIIALTIAQDAGGIVTGVLVISFAAAAAGSALVTVFLAGKKVRMARLQSDFVANVSHELRTPLSAIRLYAQTLQSLDPEAAPDETARCLAIIVRETQWLDLLIDHVLTWRGSAGNQLHIDMRLQPVATTVEGAIEHFSSLVEPDGLTLTTSIDQKLRARHDAQALHSTILNLLVNAYKYTGKKKIVRVEVKRDPADAVLIAVSDNGIGLTPAEARCVFKPFYRAAPAERDIGGKGLGLAIAHYLMNRQGGSISVESTKGSGSTFSVRLPVEASS